MSFDYFSMTPSQIEEAKRKEREYAERQRMREAELRQLQIRNHKAHIAQMQKMREENHRRFMNAMFPRRYF